MVYESTAAFLLHSSAQDVSAANVGSMATLSRSSLSTQESAFSASRANWLLPSPTFPVIRPRRVLLLITANAVNHHFRPHSCKLQ